MPDKFTPTKVSIIIPARNEATRIAAQIAYLRLLESDENTRLEIIVCDGNSQDETAQIALENGARAVQSAPNRGLQQNAGAREASGGVLWFLHADAAPHPQSLKYLAHAARREKVCGGNFALRFDARTPATRAFEKIARWQRARGVYYGDSGIWTTRETFDLLGGFRDWPLFEDYDFARRMEAFAKRNGAKAEYSQLEITASARRLKNKAGQVLAQWLALQILFSLGAPPEKLARWYYRK